MRLLTDEETVCRDERLAPRLIIAGGFIMTSLTPIAPSWVYYYPDKNTARLVDQKLTDRVLNAVNYGLRLEIYRTMFSMLSLYNPRQWRQYETY